MSKRWRIKDCLRKQYNIDLGKGETLENLKENGQFRHKTQNRP
jgi:hypothetical protein